MLVDYTLACLSLIVKRSIIIIMLFSRFPSDLQRRKLWLNFINREDKDVPQYATLCSQHFDESVFDKSAFMVKILPNAVPTRKVIRHKYASYNVLQNYIIC